MDTYIAQITHDGIDETAILKAESSDDAIMRLVLNFEVPVHIHECKVLGDDEIALAFEQNIITIEDDPDEPIHNQVAYTPAIYETVSS